MTRARAGVRVVAGDESARDPEPGPSRGLADARTRSPHSSSSANAPEGVSNWLAAAPLSTPMAVRRLIRYRTRRP